MGGFVTNDWDEGRRSGRFVTIMIGMINGQAGSNSVFVTDV